MNIKLLQNTWYSIENIKRHNTIVEYMQSDSSQSKDEKYINIEIANNSLEEAGDNSNGK